MKERLETLLRVTEDQIALPKGEADGFILDHPDEETLPPDPRATLWQARERDGFHSLDQLPEAERGSEFIATAVQKWLAKVDVKTL